MAKKDEYIVDKSGSDNRNQSTPSSLPNLHFDVLQFTVRCREAATKHFKMKVLVLFGKKEYLISAQEKMLVTTRNKYKYCMQKQDQL